VSLFTQDKFYFFRPILILAALYFVVCNSKLCMQATGTVKIDKRTSGARPAHPQQQVTMTLWAASSSRGSGKWEIAHYPR
jgi:hypothetical protein